MTVYPHAAGAAPSAAQGGWQLAGTSAEAYERYLVPVIFSSMAERVLDLAGVQPGDRVLDVGCGTGIVARRAAARVGPRGSVTGLDLNADMLKVARAASEGSTPAIAWQPGDATRLPFEDGSFDVVTSQQALQFMPEPATVVREVRRVLSDRGRVAIAVLRAIHHTPAYGPVADALESHAGPQAGAMMRSPFPAWDREHLRALVSAGGFREVQVRFDIGYVRFPSVEALLRREAASSPLAAALSSLQPSAWAALVGDLESSLSEFLDDDGIVFPIQTFVALARR
jgi:ubiquinone/menaquinone biosynthesis C-methylase UbiE